jgi:uncharacterized protein
VIVDYDRHVAVDDYARLFEHMSQSWRKHFERDEFVGSVRDGAAHIRLTDRFGDEVLEGSEPGQEIGLSVAVPHQGLTINGWADQVAAKAFIGALNSHSEHVWADGGARRAAILVTPHDPAWSARVIRDYGAARQFAAVALPLSAVLLGSEQFDPVYEAAVETDLPLIVHFSGVEGHYLGAPPLSGGVHRTAYARAVLMPQLAESHIASLCFGGTLAKYPPLRVLFSGFGFAWLPSLAWRLDREWRTFRHDVPWVRKPPSEYVFDQVWLSSWPVREAAAEWEPLLAGSQAQARVVYGSHAPFDGDTVADVRAVLGADADGVLGRSGVLPAVMAGARA